MLQTDYESLAVTIELSLASPTFRRLGSNARDLLGVYEKNLDWLFPTISNGNNTLDKLCVPSLEYRSNGFVTMLAPIRDYLGPRDLPTLPPLNFSYELVPVISFPFDGKKCKENMLAGLERPCVLQTLRHVVC